MMKKISVHLNPDQNTLETRYATAQLLVTCTKFDLDFEATNFALLSFNNILESKESIDPAMIRRVTPIRDNFLRTIGTYGAPEFIKDFLPLSTFLWKLYEEGMSLRKAFNAVDNGFRQYKDSKKIKSAISFSEVEKAWRKYKHIAPYVMISWEPMFASAHETEVQTNFEDWPLEATNFFVKEHSVPKDEAVYLDFIA